MAFNAAFTVVQGDTISKMVLTDTSIGSDSNLTGRTIYLYMVDGTLLTGATIDWPIADTTITLDVLSKDYSLNILVTWQSSSPLPSPSTYSSNLISTLLGNTNNFAYSIVQRIAAQPTLLNDQEFQYNLSKLYNEIDNATQAQDNADQFSAQSAIDRAFYLQQHETTLF